MATRLVPNPYLFATATVDSGSAQSLTDFKVNGGVTDVTTAQVERADSVFLTVEDNSIRYTVVLGIAPTASLGHAVASASNFTVTGRAVNNLQIIRDGSGNAVVQATFYSYQNERS